jgi:hypothetical protein
MPSLAQLQTLAQQLEADPNKYAKHTTQLLEALEGDNQVRER